MRSLGVVIVAVAAVSLAGCGGGGSSTQKTAPVASSSPSSAAPSSPAGATSSASSASLGSTTASKLSELELEKQIESNIAANTGTDPLVSCDSGLKGPVGTKVNCVVVADRNNKTSGYLEIQAIVTDVFPHGIQYKVKQTGSSADH